MKTHDLMTEITDIPCMNCQELIPIDLIGKSLIYMSLKGKKLL